MTTPRQTIREVLSFLTEVPTLPQGMGVPELVRLGADCWEAATKLRSLTETIKERLRVAAPRTPGQHLLRGPGAVCQVTVQAPQPTLRPEVDVMTLRQVLGPDFLRLFRVQEVVTPREDFEKTLLGVDPSRKALVLAAVDMADHKPRMSFQRTP